MLGQLVGADVGAVDEDDDAQQTGMLAHSTSASRHFHSSEQRPSCAGSSRQQLISQIYALFEANGDVIPGWQRIRELLGSSVSGYNDRQVQSARSAARRKWAEAHPDNFAVAQRAELLEWARRIDRLEQTFHPLGFTELPPSFEETLSLSLNRSEVKSRFAAIFLPSEPFDPNDARAWKNRVCNRYKYWRAACEEAGILLRRIRRDAVVSEALDYTPTEAYRCDQFDAAALAWDRLQAELTNTLDEAPNGNRCECCDETKPVWMSTLQLVGRCADPAHVDPTRRGSREVPEAWKKAGADSLVDVYEGKWLCTQCRGKPSSEEIEAGHLEFDAKNNVHLPPLYEFGDATDEEIALVRMLIPCISLKVLKHGGVLSKMHSLCVPNQVSRVAHLQRTLISVTACSSHVTLHDALQAVVQVERLTNQPLLPSTSGHVFYTKKGTKNPKRKFKVRPAKVKALFDQLNPPVPPGIIAGGAAAEAAWRDAVASRVEYDRLPPSARSVPPAAPLASQTAPPGEIITEGTDEAAVAARVSEWRRRLHAAGAGCVPYAECSWNQAAAVFGDNPGEVVEIEFPEIEHEQELADDTGPSAAQHPGASESDETSSGFVNLLPAANLQRSMEEMLARGRGSQADAADAPSSSRASSSAPSFRVEGTPEPVSEFSPYFFAMAFPEIFGNGAADFIAPRPIKLDFDKWLRHMLWTGDQRAARHRVFCFVAFSMLQRRRALSQGSFFYSSRLAGSGDSDGATLESLNERLKQGDSSLARAIYHWGGNITGSDGYNASLNREIEAIISHMLQQQPPRPPSLFLTFSCAEFHWRQMLRYLAEHMRKVEGLVEAPDLLDEANKTLRFGKLQEYAHVVTLFFEQRVMAYMKDVLAPMLGITIHYGVMEFASGRGQIHLHLLAWLANGEPHRTMHAPVPDGILEGGTAARDAWRAAIAERKAHDVKHDVTSSSAPDHPIPAAPLATREPPASILTTETDAESREARVLAWKACVLERWMREFNWRATHPAGDASARWPAPEGTLPPHEGPSPLSVPPPLSLEDVDALQPAERMQRIVDHASGVYNTCKLHRCRRSYCLCQLRRRSPYKGYHECAKGGFGAEAPLVNHFVQGPMAELNEDGAMLPEAKGLAVSYDEKLGGYRVKLDEGLVALPHDESGKLYICKLDKARPAGSGGPCYAVPRCCNAEGKLCSKDNPCHGVPPLGKRPRAEPALVDDNGVLKIELPRDHPRTVQGMWICTEHWMANDDQSVIVCRQPPKECKIDELAEVAKYVSSYLTKGGKGSAEYAAIWKTMVSDADADTPVRTLVRKLLIRICGNDYPRQQARPASRPLASPLALY